MYFVTKTYDHNLGLSSCFRQPFADSHCKDPHGYPLSFKLTFGAMSLDANNWVFDFGGLKPVKEWLCENFDHRTLLAHDDPALADFQRLYDKWGFAPPVVLPFVGCEGFARHVYEYVEKWLYENWRPEQLARGLKIVSVEVREHSGNSAIFQGN